MTYQQLHEIKRDRLPYSTENYWLRPFWAPEIYNTPYLNFRKTGVIAATAGIFVESLRHIRSTFNAINYVYEYPKNSSQWSIYTKEIFSTQSFFSEWRKKLVYGAVQHSLDAGFKVAIWYYIWGGFWAPYSFADANSIRMITFSAIAGFASGWTNYPLAVARKAYYADISWPAEYRKGYRSPLHALLKIPFSEGPLYLFRGGLLHYLGNSISFWWILYTYTFIKDKCSHLYQYNGINYSLCKFIVLNFSFAVGAVTIQPFFTMKNFMDLYNKERGGNITFKSTWDANKYLKYNYEQLSSNFQPGYSRWFRSYGLVLYLTIWYADNIGMMDNVKLDPNGLETTIAKFISD